MFGYSVLQSCIMQPKAVLPVVAIRRLGAIRRQLRIRLRMTLIRICESTGRILILTVLPGYRLPGAR